MQKYFQIPENHGYKWITSGFKVISSEFFFGFLKSEILFVIFFTSNLFLNFFFEKKVFFPKFEFLRV